MSLADDLATMLREMGLVQLALVHLVLGSYVMAIAGMFSLRARSGGAVVAFTAGVAFSIATAAWMCAVVFLAFVVVSVGIFAGGVWTLDALFGVGGHGSAMTPLTRGMHGAGPASAPAQSPSALAWRRP